MYWPTTTAKRLHLSPSGLDVLPPDGAASTQSSDVAIDLVRSPSGHHFLHLSSHTLAIWSTRPAHVLVALRRTHRSVRDYGANQTAVWREDGRGIAIKTTKSFLLLYSLTFSNIPSPVYSYVPTSGTGSRSASSKDLFSPNTATLQSSFKPSPGERGNEELGGREMPLAEALAEGRGARIGIAFVLGLRIDAGVSCILAAYDRLIVSTLSPPAVQCIPWPEPSSSQTPQAKTRTTLLSRLPWIVVGAEGSTSASEPAPPHITSMAHSRGLDSFVWLTSDGRAYQATLSLDVDGAPGQWSGKCFYGSRPRRRRRSSAMTRSSSVAGAVSEAGDGADNDGAKASGPDDSAIADESAGSTSHRRGSSAGASGSAAAPTTSSLVPLPAEKHAVSVSINAKFSLLALGLVDGTVVHYTFRSSTRLPIFSHSFTVRDALRSTASYLRTGAVRSMAWTNDGHALAVASERGLTVWSAFGKLMGCTLMEDWDMNTGGNFSDAFMKGVKRLFWGPGNTELFVLAEEPKDGDRVDPDKLLFSLPFAKSAVTGQHSPDNTRYAFIQLDDSVLVYRGSDQPDMSIINPESDVWSHIKIPQSYLAENWPVRYAAISADGRLIAVAGRRGLAHYSSLSGRWKAFDSVVQEQSFTVRGGLQWYQHLLVAAVHSGSSYQIRLYSRDLPLDDRNVMCKEELPAPVILTSLFDNSLLVYTDDNTLHHYLIEVNDEGIELALCGSIAFDGVVGEPARVRGMSWMLPPSQQRFGDPMDDLTVASVIFLIDGKLVLLRPRKAGPDLEEVSYDMQILGDRIEYYWTHLSGVGTLENSLWGYDGHGIKLWLDALTIEHAELREEAHSRGTTSEDDEDDGEDDERPEYKTIEESLSMPLDFYPLCVLIEKGIVIGIEPEISLRRSLDFAIFRSSTNTHLFLHHVLRHYLEKSSVRDAVVFAAYYQGLVYFAHALEILLHAVLEEEADALLEAGISSSALVTNEDDEGEESGIEMRRGSATGSVIHHSDSRSSALALEGMTNSHSQRSDISSLAPAGGSSPPASKALLLPLVVRFLDHFDEALDVVVGCARKTEVARWSYLFDAVGKPRDLFERCLAADELKTAGSYLLVLHNLEDGEESTRNTVRLLRLAAERGKWELCKDLLRFVRSIDESGEALRFVLDEAELFGEGGVGREEVNGMGKLSLGGKEAGALGEVVEDRGKGLAPPTLGGVDTTTTTTTPNGGLSRSTSAPNILDPPREEDEEEDVSASHSESAPTSVPVPEEANATPSSLNVSNPRPYRSTSLFAPRGGLNIPASSSPIATSPLSPPVPTVSVNGRIMPAPAATSSDLSSSPSSASPKTAARPWLGRSPSSGSQSSLTSNNGGGGVGGGGLTSPLGSGLGMSLSRVGLRSTDRLWDLSAGAGGSPTSPGGAQRGSPRGAAGEK